MTPFQADRRPFGTPASPTPIGGSGLREGFTLVELLVTITVIGILAGISLGALNAARQTARVAKTKATIAKLDQIVMKKYESYRTRRVPINTSGLISTTEVARVRLVALRDLMRMEMPERFNDISDNPLLFDVTLRGGTTAQRSVQRSSLSRRYASRYATSAPSGDNSAAECLYLFVSLGTTDARENFSESEIGDTDDDGWPEFIDGWGTPIRFLRWAPGFSSDTSLGFNGDSQIQSGNPNTDHDPFDSRNVEPGAFQLFPLIYSYGPDKRSGIDVQQNQHYALPDGPYRNLNIGAPDGTGEHYDNIHNHHIEQR